MSKTEHALPGYAAFSPRDMRDAKRRRPEADLAAYAQSRGLEQLGTKNAMGFLGVMPFDARLQHNVVRGALPGGVHGIVFHQTYAWPVSDGSPDGGGTFYGVVYSPKIRLRPTKADFLGMLPVIGWFIEGEDPETRPHAVGIPITVAATRIPEAATVGDFSIDNRSKPWLTSDNHVRLKDHGMPGWHLVGRGRELDHGFVERLLTGRLAEVLATAAEFPYAELRWVHGQLAARINGYLDDPAQLDALTGWLAAAAACIKDSAAPLLAPRPFSAPLEGVDWPDDPGAVSMSGRFPPMQWLTSLHEFARKNGLTIEDPTAYHRALPTNPAPGRAFIVMRGKLPGTEAVGRVAWHAERSIDTHNVGRTAILMEAAPGAPEGYLRIPERNLDYEVRDGMLAVWTLRSSEIRGDLGDAAGLAVSAVALARERGLASV